MAVKLTLSLTLSRLIHNLVSAEVGMTEHRVELEKHQDKENKLPAFVIKRMKQRIKRYTKALEKLTEAINIAETKERANRLRREEKKRFKCTS